MTAPAAPASGSPASGTPTPGMRFGYGTNGFVNHRLDDVLTILADLGYDNVSLTLDHGHLDPYADDLPRRVAALARRLDRLGLSVMVETGAPYLLDPWGKHLPNLMSGPEGTSRRVDLLERAIRIAADLGSPVVHLCSGPAPDGIPGAEAWDRLTAGCEAALKTAEAYGIALAFEPEPYMFIDVVDRWLELSRRLGGHELFGITLDIGHAHCVEEIPLLDCVTLAAPTWRTCRSRTCGGAFTSIWNSEPERSTSRPCSRPSPRPVTGARYPWRSRAPPWTPPKWRAGQWSSCAPRRPPPPRQPSSPTHHPYSRCHPHHPVRSPHDATRPVPTEPHCAGPSRGTGQCQPSTSNTPSTPNRILMTSRATCCVPRSTSSSQDPR